MWCCTGFRYEETDPCSHPSRFAVDAARTANNIERLMQTGSQHIKVESTKDGIRINFDCLWETEPHRRRNCEVTPYEKSQQEF
jgi:hypothetical protein